MRARQRLGVPAADQVDGPRRAVPSSSVAHRAAHEPASTRGRARLEHAPAHRRRRSSRSAESLTAAPRHARHARGQAAGDLVVDRAERARELLGQSRARPRRRRSASRASPTATVGSRPTSTVMLSMLTVPTSGIAAPADQHVGRVRQRRAGSRRRIRSAAPPRRSAAGADQVRPYPALSPGLEALHLGHVGLAGAAPAPARARAGSSLKRVQAVDRDAAARHVEMRALGSRSAAALLAAWTMQPGCDCACARSTNGRKRSSCSSKKPSRARPRSRDGSSAPPAAAPSEAAAASSDAPAPRTGPRVPSRPIPVSSFTCIARGRSLAAAVGRAQRTTRATRPRRLPRRRRPRAPRRQRAHHQHGHVDAVLAQLGRLGGGRDGEPGRTARERRARAGDGAVPVAIGLHDRTQLRAAADGASDARSCARPRPRSTIAPPAAARRWRTARSARPCG